MWIAGRLVGFGKTMTIHFVDIELNAATKFHSSYGIGNDAHLKFKFKIIHCEPMWWWWWWIEAAAAAQACAGVAASDDDVFGAAERSPT